MREFHTSDTALAAYLFVSGIKLAKLNTDTDPAEYTFKDPGDGAIGTLILQWERNEVDCARFYRAYKRFVAQIKNARSARDG